MTFCVFCHSSALPGVGCTTWCHHDFLHPEPCVVYVIFNLTQTIVTRNKGNSIDKKKSKHQIGLKARFIFCDWWLKWRKHFSNGKKRWIFHSPFFLDITYFFIWVSVSSIHLTISRVTAWVSVYVFIVLMIFMECKY